VRGPSGSWSLNAFHGTHKVLSRDHRPVLDWWSDLLVSVIQRVATYTLQFAITNIVVLIHCYLLRTQDCCTYSSYILVLTSRFSLSLLGTGFQQLTFPLLWVPEIPQSQLPDSNSNSSRWHSSTCPLTLPIKHQPEDEVEVNLWPSVSRPVCPYVGLPSGANDQFFFLSDNCGFLVVGHPLWREDGSEFICSIASGPCQNSHSRVEVPQNSWPYFTVHLRLPNLEGQVPVFISPKTRWPSYTPRHWVPFAASYDSQGYGGSILTRPRKGIKHQLLTSLAYNISAWTL
jgi:hypothetical protein